MKNTPNQPIAIFKPGRFTAMNGESFDFTEADLAASAKAYDPALHEAPFVIGHPKDNLPAYAWTESVSFVDGLMTATPRDMMPEFAEWIKGPFKKRSASFYPPGHPSNPVPEVYYLRHVGFLGAQPPAVKGLPDPQFHDDGDNLVTIEFSEPEETNVSEEEKAKIAAEQEKLAKQQADFAEQQTAFQTQQAAIALREAELAKKEQAAKKLELVNFAETQIKAGKLLPKDKAGLVEFMAQLDNTSVVEFSEGDAVKKVPSLDWLKGFITGLPKVIEFSEVTGDDGKLPTKGLTEVQLANKARAYHKAQSDLGNHISFSEAVDAVIAEEG